MINRRVIIHIGFPKTATTWFQQEFFPNINNITYIPRFKVLRDYIIKPLPLDFNAQLAINKIESYLSEIPYTNTIVISDEIYLNGNEFLLNEYTKRLKEIFTHPEIILFIRNQETLLISLYSQYIRGNYGTFSFTNFIFPKLNGLARPKFLNLETYEFDRMIKYLRNLFGKDHLFIFLYEEFSENPLLFCENFALKFNFEIKLERLSYKKQNDGIRHRLLYFARFLNCFTRNNRYEKYYIIHIPRFSHTIRNIINNLNKYKIFGKTIDIKKMLNRKDYDAIISRYKSSNKKLLQDYHLQNISNYNYPL